MRQIDTNWAYEQYSTIVRNTINGDDTYYGRYAELMVLEVGIDKTWELPEGATLPDGNITQMDRYRCADKIVEYLNQKLGLLKSKTTFAPTPEWHLIHCGFESVIEGLEISVYILRDGSMVCCEEPYPREETERRWPWGCCHTISAVQDKSHQR